MTFRRSESRFYMIQDPSRAADDYRFEIQHFTLHVPIIKLSESILPHIATLCDTYPSRYKCEIFECRTHNLPQNTEVVEIPNLFTGKLPQRVIVCAYKQSDFTGRKTSNPMFTSNTLKIRTIKLCQNGVVQRELSPSFDDGMYAECYRSFVELAEASDVNFMVSKEDYKKGHR